MITAILGGVLLALVIAFTVWVIRLEPNYVSFKFEDYENRFESEEAKAVGKSIFYKFHEDWTLNSKRTILTHKATELMLFEDDNKLAYNSCKLFSENDAKLIHTLVFVAGMNRTLADIEKERQEKRELAREIGKTLETDK